MNKHIVSALVLATFVVVTAAPALADQPSSPSPSSSPRLRNESRQEDNDTKKAAQQAKRDTERKNRILKFWKKTGDRLQNLINRETKIAKKIGDRLQKFKDAGKNVDAQKAMLDSAILKIGLAQKTLDDAIAQIGMLLAANKPAEALAKARELHKGVVAAIRTAHKALIDVIVATRGMSATPSPSATPTP